MVTSWPRGYVIVQVRNGCITMPDNYVKDHVIIYTRILRSVPGYEFK